MTQDHARVRKYAAMVTNWTYGQPQTVRPSADIECGWWCVDNVDTEQSRESWREAFGSFEWDHLHRNRACMFVYADDVTDSTNAVNDTLLDRVRLASYAYLLHRPPIRSGGSLWLVSGLANENGRADSLRSWVRMPKLYLPWFFNQPAFDVPLQDFLTNAWTNGWSNDFAALVSAAGGDWLISPPFEMAVLSFMDASTNESLDFRMPALVRTIEALIAVPAGALMKQTFVERTRLFANDVQTHQGFIASGRTIERVLKDLYQLRSDAVHGKWPLRAMKDVGQLDDVALLDFAGEMICRSIIKWALRHRAFFATHQTRQSLEGAWTNQRVPPP